MRDTRWAKRTDPLPLSHSTSKSGKVPDGNVEQGYCAVGLLDLTCRSGNDPNVDCVGRCSVNEIITCTFATFERVLFFSLRARWLPVCESNANVKSSESRSCFVHMIAEQSDLGSIYGSAHRTFGI